MASIRKRGNRYYVDYYFRGRRVRRSVAPSRRIALDVLKDVQGRQVRDDAGLAVLDLNCDKALDEFIEDRNARNTAKWAAHQERVLKDLISWSGVKRLRLRKNGIQRPLDYVLSDQVARARDWQVRGRNRPLAPAVHQLTVDVALLRRLSYEGPLQFANKASGA